KIQHFSFFRQTLLQKNKKATQQSEPLVMLLSISADSFWYHYSMESFSLSSVLFAIKTICFYKMNTFYSMRQHVRIFHAELAVKKSNAAFLLPLQPALSWV